MTSSARSKSTLTPRVVTLRISGCWTALVTPFTADGAVDEQALRLLVDWQITEGIHGLVPIGSTGEAVTLTAQERDRVVRIVVEAAAGRVPIMAGAGSNDTKQAVENSKAMRAAGATHLLHVSPMYNKPPQRGLIAHFKAIAESAGLPVCVYNVPGRTASNIEPATTLALADVPSIVAVKEASGNLAQIDEIIRHRPPHFAVLSGDDSFTLAVMGAGGDGVVSVISNAVPRAMAQLCERAAKGDLTGARSAHAKLAPFMSAAFVESNPIPVKAAMAMLGRMQNVLRLPLVPLRAELSSTVRRALVDAGALSS
ncbi:MAG TPA: 4-hydroxy-tetrahydrodipicolinate synthase [Gemmatimonadaceae bacterium]|nr:4-hydroxy-tetrahydrodipicolinate synthase [Gemmatimonadaceae bacterium]